MNLDVYDHTNATLLGTLVEPFGVEFLDDLTIPGFARFQLDTASTADLALCQPRRVVRFRTGAGPGVGDVFAAIIQDRPAVLNDQVQPTGGLSTVTVECRGLLAWLGGSEGGAVLYPSRGLGGRQQNPRVFGWQTEDFDDSNWGTVDTSMTAGRLSTEGWPDGQAVAFEPIFEGDRALYRRFLPALNIEDTSARMYLVATVRTEVNVWLDGELVLTKPRNQQGLFYADVTYEDLDHQLAVEVTGGTGRWGWTWMSTNITLDEDGNEEVTAGTALRRTYDPAEFPAADTPWLSFEGGPNDWQQPAFVPDATWVRPVSDGPLTTAGFPDGQAVAYFSEPGRGRFFRQIESSAGVSGATMTLVAEVNTSVRLFVNNAQVAFKPSGGRGLFEFEVDYPAEDFVLSAVVVGGGRWGWTWQDGGSTLRRTYDPETFSDADPWWYKPDDVPGVTTGFVLKTALDEDGDRHARPWSYSFDGDQDSDGQPYAVTFSRGFRVQEVGRLVDELVSIEGEPDMAPSGTFRWVVRRGEDRTGTVTVTSPFGLQLSGRGPQSTRWLYETQSGFGQALTDGPEAEFGVMERFVQLGSDISSQSIGAVVSAAVRGEAGVRDEVQVELPDDVTPYVDCWLGDEVTCQGRDGTAPVRLNSFHGRVDDDTGVVEWTATGVPG